ncbi:hypothetical protein PILCRDRAFT_3238 [Piloderma croceum F 1598]|uniref:Uncharacterized protein n=1 Tax=Piloderma croceum (strain F 1598) TaxID=765440 RepID=A0A0C3FUX8_PILCF|nr:hypothetical protein PILCRDRAFT_3238 [Piloderma croceum F 1598]
MSSSTEEAEVEGFDSVVQPSDALEHIILKLKEAVTRGTLDNVDLDGLREVERFTEEWKLRFDYNSLSLSRCLLPSMNAV